MIDKDEELIGTAGNPNDEIFITSTNINKTYCSNCRKRQHCIHGINKKHGEQTIMLKDKCNNPDCECRCRRFYEAKDGKLRPLDTIDDSDPLDGFNTYVREPIDDLIDQLNQKAREDKSNMRQSPEAII